MIIILKFMEKKHRDRNKIIEIKKTFKRPKIV